MTMTLDNQSVSCSSRKMNRETTTRTAKVRSTTTRLPTVSFSSALEHLPEIMLEEILSYVSMTERRRLIYPLSSRLWKFGQNFDRRLKEWTLTAHDLPLMTNAKLYYRGWIAIQSPQRLLPTFHNLQELRLENFATDDFFGAIRMRQQQQQHSPRNAPLIFPQLRKLSMVRSLQVTDQGLEHVAFSLRSLEEIDLTYCRNTTYAGTFVLRDELPFLKLLRRQPKWLDGRFHTPFQNNNDDDNKNMGSSSEIHTYWPDGSFSFNRSSQSNGFVCDWVEYDSEGGLCYVGDKLQYNDFSVPIGWSEATKFSYRPGVCLLRLEYDDADDDDCCVLVGQRVRGVRRPDQGHYELMKQARSMVPTGETRYFDGDSGALLEGGSNERAHRRQRETIMVSKMKLVPFRDTESKLPPKELVEACRETCRQMKPYGNSFLAMQEEILHTLMTQF